MKNNNELKELNEFLLSKYENYDEIKKMKSELAFK